LAHCMLDFPYIAAQLEAYLVTLIHDHNNNNSPFFLYDPINITLSSPGIPRVGFNLEPTDNHPGVSVSAGSEVLNGAKESWKLQLGCYPDFDIKFDATISALDAVRTISRNFVRSPSKFSQTLILRTFLHVSVGMFNLLNPEIVEDARLSR